MSERSFSPPRSGFAAEPVPILAEEITAPSRTSEAPIFGALRARGQQVFKKEPWVAPLESDAPGSRPAVVGWPHKRGWVFCTLGLADALSASGPAAGVELSLAAAGSSDEPPRWAAQALRALGRTVLDLAEEPSLRGWELSPGDLLSAPSGRLSAFLLERDPVLDRLDTGGDLIGVLACFGLTHDEARLLESWEPRRFLQEIGRLKRKLNDPRRESLLAHPRLGDRLLAAAEKEGGRERSVRYLLFRLDLIPGGPREVVVAADSALDLAVRLESALAEGRTLTVLGPHSRLVVRPGRITRSLNAGHRSLEIALDEDDARRLVRALLTARGLRPLRELPFDLRVLPPELEPPPRRS